MNPEIPQFGVGDASFQAAGGESGIRALVGDFYDIMATDERFKTIISMHPTNRELSIEKLTLFLCGWLGGPRLFKPKYGSISIPLVHDHLPITQAEHDQWLQCMYAAIGRQTYSLEFGEYLIRQLAVPAASVLRRTQEKHATQLPSIPSTITAHQ